MNEILKWEQWKLIQAIHHIVQANGRKLDMLLKAGNFSVPLQSEIDKIDADTAALLEAVAKATPTPTP